MKTILLLTLLPIASGLITLLIPSRLRGAKEIFAVLAAMTNLIAAILLFKHDFMLTLPWCGFGIDFSFRLYPFSAFIILAIASFGFLVALYSTAFMAGKPHLDQFYAYLLLTIGLANGAVLADNLILLLFFWEGLLLTLFGMIMIGGRQSFKTAIKAFIIIGITDLCLMLGIALTGYLADTFMLSRISLPLTPLGSLAFILMMIGAIAKAGSIPFHSWIPDAASDAPLPFMAFLPAAMEKLLGIYFLTRISLDLFILHPDSWLSMLMMIVGSITILLAVMMALIQKEYKRLLAYHAISQVGYMILGIGTALPAGIVGGLFHMINNAIYKSCLFLSGGSVEKQTGTTDLKNLGGLAAKMPITFACFLIAAISISGVPPFNGFFSKELVYDGALERGWIFYLVAVLGSFFTAASFLKLGHAVYLGKTSEPAKKAKEASWVILLPMLILAGFCILFGIFNALPLNHLIQPILPEHLAGHNYAGLPGNMIIVGITVLVLLAAFLNHLYGVKKSGHGIGAVDHIHHAPGLSSIYDLAEKRFFDPYEIGMKIADWFSVFLSWIDRFVDWFYEIFIVRITMFFSSITSMLHSGNFSLYIFWSLIGAVLLVIFAIK